MTKEIKILFTKKNVENIPADQLKPNTKGLIVEIETDFHMSSLCSLEHANHPVSDASFTRMAFIFENNTESEIYNNLLARKNKTFEITFDLNKVWLNVDGFCNLIDKTKPEVKMNPGSKKLIFFLEPKFQGIIKLSVRERERERERERDRERQTQYYYR